jgi:hypothetical protein
MASAQDKVNARKASSEFTTGVAVEGLFDGGKWFNGATARPVPDARSL